MQIDLCYIANEDGHYYNWLARACERRGTPVPAELDKSREFSRFREAWLTQKAMRQKLGQMS